ncbi:MAG: hypothetical protein H6R01_1153 [Burkholderiaceae bacterium]|nr:hypothetical protein [Burkholderiaceae bacterium]
MGEAKRRKAMGEMYGMGKLPLAAQPFVLAMQEMVEHEARMVSGEKADSVKPAKNAHQFFFGGNLGGESGVCGLSIPATLVDFGEYAFTAPINALTGFMGVARFGMAMHLAEDRQPVPSAAASARGSAIMMLACIKGDWFYNMIRSDGAGVAAVQGMSDWKLGRIEELALSEPLRQFMTAMTATLKKSRGQQDAGKATMTLNYLKEHYRAVVAESRAAHAGGEVVVN